MAAWTIISMWVVGIAIKAFPPTASLADGERWFSGSEQLLELVSGRAINKVETTLQRGADTSAYYDLLPYILDPHGPGSRLSVKRDPGTLLARKRKRAEGVFYTPADVAKYMAGACLAEARTIMPPSIFDPACGTGVFLRAALHELRRHYPDRCAFSRASECLFGADIDPWPLDATAFVLLADSWSDRERKNALPAEVWRRLRMNLACIDTLRIDPAECANQRNPTRVPISALFPVLKKGPVVVLGNPPYTDLGKRSDVSELRGVFESLAVKPEANAEIHLAFVEQLIRLANSEDCSGALVLPLSIACNVGMQFSKTRELISRTCGRWRFAFFDREPHALFGEDVKTRNAIVLWSRTASDTKTVFATGPMRKWRGDSRAAMFKSLKFTVVDHNIRAGVPKIDGPLQAAAMKTLSMRWGCLEQVVLSIERIDLDKVLDADDLTVWWWHAYGDDFHVSRRFIAELPFSIEDLSDGVTSILSEHGAALWSAIKTKPIISLNRGSTSLAYMPNGHDYMRRQIDETLTNLMRLESAFVDELQQFTAHTVAATLRTRKATVTATEERETA